MAFTIQNEPNSICSSRNPIAFRVIADADWASDTTHVLKFTIQTESGYRNQAWSDLISLEFTPDQNGEVVCDLSSILQSLVSPERPPDAGTSWNWYRCTQMNARYRVKIDEVIDGVSQSDQTTSAKHVVWAGFPPHLGQHMESWKQAGKWLNSFPYPKLVSEYEMNFGYWIVPEGVTTINTATTYELLGGTTGAFPDSDTFDVQENDVVIFNMRSPSVATAVLPSLLHTILHIENQSGDQVSEDVKLQLRTVTSPYLRHYMFVNALGAHETVVTLGKLNVKQEVESQYAEKIISPFAELEAEIVPYNTQHIEVSEQYFGELTKDEAKWLRELLRSDVAYRCSDDEQPHPEGYGHRIPIIIDRESSNIWDDETPLDKLKFSYRDAIRRK